MSINSQTINVQPLCREPSKSHYYETSLYQCTHGAEHCSGARCIDHAGTNSLSRSVVSNLHKSRGSRRRGCSGGTGATSKHAALTLLQIIAAGSTQRAAYAACRAQKRACSPLHRDAPSQPRDRDTIGPCERGETGGRGRLTTRICTGAQVGVCI